MFSPFTQGRFAQSCLDLGKCETRKRWWTWLRSHLVEVCFPLPSRSSCSAVFTWELGGGFLQVVSFSLWTPIQGTSSNWSVSHFNLFLNRHLNRESKAIWKLFEFGVDVALSRWPFYYAYVYHPVLLRSVTWAMETFLEGILMNQHSIFFSQRSCCYCTSTCTHLGHICKLVK